MTSDRNEVIIKSFSVIFIIFGVAILSFFHAQEEEETPEDSADECEIPNEREQIEVTRKNEEYVEEETEESQKLAEKISTEKISMKHVMPGHHNK